MQHKQQQRCCPIPLRLRPHAGLRLKPSDAIVIKDCEGAQRDEKPLKGNLRRPSELCIGVVM